jgi:FkbM family methyltransferase
MMTTLSAGLQQELEDLLSEGVEKARKREKASFDEMTGSKTASLVLFGAGNLGRRTLTGMRKAGIEPLCFVDNNRDMWGKSVSGVLVLRPEEGAERYGTYATFVVTIWRGEGKERMSERITQLRALGCASVVPFLALYWKLSGSLLPHYTHDLPHRVHLHADRVRQAFQLMADDASRLEYLAQIRFRLLGDFDALADPVEGDIYFREDLFALRKDETLVDCGAFDGDTLSVFIDRTGGSFNRVIAFEPDPSNYTKLVERIDRIPADLSQRIALHPAATGEKNERVLMDVGIGPASHIGSGDHEVECFTLDSILDGVPVSILKMDIEGSELATLAGAARLIRQNSPILAICVYHRQSDLWDIPLLIQSLGPDYSFYLRPHLLEGWDLVCYAVPKHRLRH